MMLLASDFAFYFMMIRQLKKEQYEQLHNDLMQHAHTEPLDAGCTVGITVNGVEYAIKVQPEKHYKMAVLQALRIDRSEGIPRFELITKNSLLSSFFEILVYQKTSQ